MDLIAITETWLNIGEKKQLPWWWCWPCLPIQFKVVVNRRDDMKCFKFMDVDVSSSRNSMKLVIIYRPPPSEQTFIR